MPLHLQESERELGSHASGHLDAVGATSVVVRVARRVGHAVCRPARHSASLKQQLAKPWCLTACPADSWARCRDLPHLQREPANGEFCSDDPAEVQPAGRASATDLRIDRVANFTKVSQTVRLELQEPRSVALWCSVKASMRREELQKSYNQSQKWSNTVERTTSMKHDRQGSQAKN